MFDIDGKVVTRESTQSTTQQKSMMLDFSKEFPKYDVMEELGLDPLDLGKLDLLRPKLR